MNDTTTQTTVAAKLNNDTSKSIIIRSKKYPNLKNLFDDVISECNDREIGRNISYSDVLNYLLEEMDGDDIEAVQEKCLNPEEFFEIEFRREFNRPSKGKELLLWVKERL